jgi:hypothetical protein
MSEEARTLQQFQTSTTRLSGRYPLLKENKRFQAVQRCGPSAADGEASRPLQGLVRPFSQRLALVSPLWLLTLR